MSTLEYRALCTWKTGCTLSMCVVLGVYSTARVLAVRQLICGKRGRSLGTYRAEGAKYSLPIAWGGIIYAQERIASFRNLFVLRFIYILWHISIG